jgi:hypothetical protein
MESTGTANLVLSPLLHRVERSSQVRSAEVVFWGITRTGCLVLVYAKSSISQHSVSHPGIQSSKQGQR